MSSNQKRTILVTGAAGFIGSQLTDQLLKDGNVVIGLDNFSRGTEENLVIAKAHPNFSFLTINLANEEDVIGELLNFLQGTVIDEVWHMAANSDIPAGVKNSKIDYLDTFMTTFNILSLMRLLAIPKIVFASTSAVYGENSAILTETTGPFLPISNYGAMKLASEGAISAATEAFLDQAIIYRFPNVIGPRLTHGVIYDFIAKLRHNPSELEVLGDGTQQKLYLHVSELIKAMLYIRDESKDKVSLFNIGPEDDGVAVSVIANEVVNRVNKEASIRFTGGDRGWVGDVPRFRYSIQKLKDLGWHTSSSSLESVRRTICEALHSEDSK